MVREMMVMVISIVMMVMMVGMMVIVTNMDMILSNSKGSVVRMVVVWKHGVPTQQQIDRQQQETDDLTLFHGGKGTKNSQNKNGFELRMVLHLLEDEILRC